MPNNTAQILGYLARQQGRNEGHCPYPQGSRDRENWIAGFNSKVPPEQMNRKRPTTRTERDMRPQRAKAATNRWA